MVEAVSEVTPHLPPRRNCSAARLRLAAAVGKTASRRRSPRGVRERADHRQHADAIRDTETISGDNILDDSGGISSPPAGESPFGAYGIKYELPSTRIRRDLCRFEKKHHHLAQSRGLSSTCPEGIWLLSVNLTK